jgi:hypothetical protein
MKVNLEGQLRLNRAAAGRWALGFAIAACIWTGLVGSYVWTSQGGSDPLTVGNMTEEWAVIGVPLIAGAALLFVLSRWPRSRP